MASDADDGGGFVLNLAGVDDGASRDEPERRGNPMRRTVMRAPRKGRHRGWAGKKPGASEARGGGRGRGAGRGGRGAPAGGRGAPPAGWEPADAPSAPRDRDGSSRGDGGGGGGSLLGSPPAATTTPSRAAWRGGKDGRGAAGAGRGGGRGVVRSRGPGARAAQEVVPRAHEADDDADDPDAFDPSDFAALMRKAMTPLTDAEKTAAALSRAPADPVAAAIHLERTRARVFGQDAATWEGVGLPERLATRLRDASTNRGFAAPTRVQRAAIPHILRGDDVLVRAETGSGKTLAYLCPIFAALGALENPRVRREDGARALVMVPTRELAAQVMETASRVAASAYHWVVAGVISGGENKQKEKARLRKGVSVLVATPGRLLDHLRHTAAFRCDALRWLVLDEADRMLDQGFEEDLNAILAELTRRVAAAAAVPSADVDDEDVGVDTDGTDGTGRKRWCTALFSATLTAGTSRLVDLAMRDPVSIEIEPEEPEIVAEDGNGRRAAKNGTTIGGDGRAAGAEATDAAGASAGEREHVSKAAASAPLRMPEQIRHTAVEVPAKARLATLAGLLAGWMRGAVSKVMVFLSSCESVEFHYRALSWLAGSGDGDGGEKEGGADASPGGGGGYSVFRLHGVLSQADRRKVYAAFAATKAGVLLCTDVGARGLDFQGVGATVQADAPSDPTTYVHRVGRAGRLGREGEAVLFLQPRETPYAETLAETLGVEFCAASVPAMLDVLGGGGVGGDDEGANPRERRRVEREPHLHPAATALQRRLHAEVARDKDLATLAKDAFRAHVRAYATFPANLKHIFHVKKLHLGHVAAQFGLKEAPGLIGKSATRERLQAAKDKKRQESVRAKRDAAEKRKRRTAGKMAPRKATRGQIVGAS